MNRRQLLFSPKVVGLLGTTTEIFREMRRDRFLTVLFLAVLAVGFPGGAANGQTNEWAWMNGTKTPEPGVYGTLGMPATGNMPGNRSSAVSWTDNKGNLWLFGGDGFDSAGRGGDLNDLWEYNPSTNQWVWMGGSSTLNGFVASGVSGTLGTPATGNIPRGRAGAVGWTDTNGNLWLFGGYSFTFSNNFNDLWEFNPSTNQWAWMSGSNAESCGSCNALGSYGNLGIAAVGNVPGPRMNSVSWTDSKGNFWLFGGYGIDSSGMLGWLNDLWEFNPSTNQWTWMSGSNTIPRCNMGDCGQPGVYGTQGTPAGANTPGARYSASGWTDGKGNFWLFGGSGFDSAGNMGLLNDLWEFNPSTDQWTWVGGSSGYPASCSVSLPDECGQAGIYGVSGTPGTGNIPGVRQGGASWTDSRAISGSLAAMTSTQTENGAISMTSGSTVLLPANGRG